MLRVRLFVHVHLLILVYYVFPQLVKRVLIHSLIDFLCMLLQPCGMPLDLDIRLLPFDTFKKSVKTHLYLKYFDSYCIYIICMIFLFLQCVSTVIIVYIIISPLNSYLYIHWILDFK